MQVLFQIITSLYSDKHDFMLSPVLNRWNNRLEQNGAVGHPAQQVAAQGKTALLIRYSTGCCQTDSTEAKLHCREQPTFSCVHIHSTALTANVKELDIQPKQVFIKFKLKVEIVASSCSLSQLKYRNIFTVNTDTAKKASFSKQLNVFLVSCIMDVNTWIIQKRFRDSSLLKTEDN